MSMSNSQVAHVWAAGTKAHGASSNGNLYFDGRILFSYGSHFAVGVRMNDGQAILNSGSYSVSTSGHQSDARHAVNHMRTVSVPDLQDIARDLSYIANNGVVTSKGAVQSIIRYVEKNAAALQVETTGAYVSGRWNTPDGEYAEGADYIDGYYEKTGMTRAAVLLSIAGIHESRAAPAIKRGLAAAAKKAKADAAETRKREKAEAARVADMTLLERDTWFADFWHIRPLDGRRHNDESSVRMMREASKRLFRMQKTAKAEGFSAKRQAALKEARAKLQATIRAYDEDSAELVATLKAERFAVWAAEWSKAKTGPDRVAVWTGSRVRPGDYEEGTPERAALDAALQLFKADVAEQQREAVEAWKRGENSLRLTAPDGSAYVRRSLDGERLETSHGADVPWDHAVKAFRFIRLCVEKGEGFRTNGRVIRVGHFRVDEITPQGDMRAGCHRFAWADMAALAEAEGVFNLTPSAEAVETNA